jgi:hypothetical protein
MPHAWFPPATIVENKRFGATATSLSALPQNTPPPAVVPHIETFIDGAGVARKSCVAAMVAKRTVDETGSGTSSPCPQQKASPPVLRPHVRVSLAETAMSAGTTLTRSGTELHGVWMTIL